MSRMKQGWRDSIANSHKRALDAGLWRARARLSSAQGAMIQIGTRSLVNFSSNDYLGLANHSALKAGVRKATNKFGVGSGASHLVCGHLDLHHQLERELAVFVGAEKALLFSSGYMANLAITSAFLCRGDLLLQDKLNHASLIDGANLSAANARRYAHCNLGHAARLIVGIEFNRCMIASDSVFSMDGDLAPLAELNAIASRHRSLLIVDDAHGFGVLGANGRGSLELANLAPTGDVIMMGTLGKALGCYGAFVAGDELYIEHLIQFARPYIYTTALPPSVPASVLAALALLDEEGNSLRHVLNSNIDYFKQGVLSRDIPAFPSCTAIQPLLIGDPHDAVRISGALFDDGFNVIAIRPPTVAKGSARLRVTLSAAHSYQQIDGLLNSLEKHLIGS